MVSVLAQERNKHKRGRENKNYHKYVDPILVLPRVVQS